MIELVTTDGCASDDLSAAEREFTERYPHFDLDGTFAELRRSEYGRLDDGDHVYLDYTGGGLHGASQVDAHAELLRTLVLGNPHSTNPTSLSATELVDQTRRVVCEFFNAPPEDYLCVFTANASTTPDGGSIDGTQSDSIDLIYRGDGRFDAVNPQGSGITIN